MISGRSSETTYEQTENLKPGKTSSVTAAPPSDVPALEHQDLAPGAREVGGGGQPVVAAADDDGVVLIRENGPRLETRIPTIDGRVRRRSRRRFW